MANTTYTASQIATRAKSYAYFAAGYCLKFCKTVATPTVNSPYSAYLGTANAAWSYAQHKEYTNNPPAGAMVYWRSGMYGHIAISLGGGYVRSTDWPSKGRVGTVSISRITSAWGMTYRGWSRDYAGLSIPGIQEGSSAPGTKSVDLSSAIYLSHLRPGATNGDVARFEKALWNWMGPDWRTRNAGLSPYYGDTYWGTVTTNTMLAAYAKMGMNTAGVSYPGPQMLHNLGFKDVR